MGIVRWLPFWEQKGGTYEYVRSFDVIIGRIRGFIVP